MSSLTNDECRRNIEGETNEIHVIHDNSTLCVQSINKNATTVCSPDSAGPLVFNNELIGVSSWSFSCPFSCARSMPDSFSRVSEYIDWIAENMRI